MKILSRIVRRRVYAPQMKVEHRSQQLFVFKIVTCEFEPYSWAGRTGPCEEVVVRLGLYEEQRLCHGGSRRPTQSSLLFVVLLNYLLEKVEELLRIFLYAGLSCECAPLRVD